jgi:hypothetical protein
LKDDRLLRREGIIHAQAPPARRRGEACAGKSTRCGRGIDLDLHAAGGVDALAKVGGQRGLSAGRPVMIGLADAGIGREGLVESSGVTVTCVLKRGAPRRVAELSTLNSQLSTLNCAARLHPRRYLRFAAILNFQNSDLRGARGF